MIPTSRWRVSQAQGAWMHSDLPIAGNSPEEFAALGGTMPCRVNWDGGGLWGGLWLGLPIHSDSGSKQRFPQWGVAILWDSREGVFFMHFSEKNRSKRKKPPTLDNLSEK